MKQAGRPATAVFRVVPNDTTTANLLLSGEVNAATIAGPDKKRADDAGYAVASVKAPIGQLYFNQTAGRPTADVTVRSALTQALDLTALRDIVSGGEGTTPTSLVTVAPLVCHGDTVTGNVPTHNEKAAAKSLDDAGWKLGSDGIRHKDVKPLALKYTYVAATGDPGAAASEFIQMTWKKLGVDVSIQGLDTGAIDTTLFGGGDWDITALTVGVSLPSMLVPFYSGPVAPAGMNFIGLDDPKYKAAVAAAGTKPGSAGCGDWEAAEQEVIRTVSVVPYADLARIFYGNKVSYAMNDGIDPWSIRMYQ